MKNSFFFLFLSITSSAFSSVEKFEMPVEGLGKMTYVQKPLIASEKKLTSGFSVSGSENFFGNERASLLSCSALTIGGNPVRPVGKEAGYFLYAPDEGEDLNLVEKMATQGSMNRVYGLHGSDPNDRRILTNKIFVFLKEEVKTDTFKKALGNNYEIEDLGYGELYIKCGPENPLKVILKLRENKQIKNLVESIEPDFAVQSKRYP